VSRSLVANPFAGIAIVVAALLVMLSLLHQLRTRLSWHPEIFRKCSHVGLGIVCLSFPWLFANAWPVFALSGFALLALLALRVVPALRASVGRVVHGVQRSSGGDLYFPLAASGLFALSHGDWVLYTIPVLTLTLADAVAALIGIFYGKVRFDGGDGPKTIEGSIAFFVVAFLAAHAPLLLFTSTGRAESLLIGVTFGILVMMLEALAWRGLDNLFIPFGGFMLLKVFVRLDAPALLTRLLVAVSLLALMLVIRHRKTLSDSGLLAAVLVGYLAWSAGGWRWLLPPVVLYLSYTRLYPRSAQQRDRPHDVLSVLSVASTGILWLVAWATDQRTGFYYAYTIAYAANLAFIGVVWFLDYRRRESPYGAALVAAALAWLTLFAPYVLVLGVSRIALQGALLALMPLTLGALLFIVAVPHVRGRASQNFPWVRQAALSLGVSALGLVLAQSWRLTP
jgi:phytol kinase